MKAPSLTIILSGIFLAYIAHSIWTMYNMFNPASCSPAQSKHCISSYLERKAPIEISVYGSKYEKIQQSDLVLLWHMEEFDPYKDAEIEVNVSVPLKTRSNGTYYAHAFVSPKGESLESGRSSWRIHKSVLLTTYALPQAETFQLIGNQTEKKTNDVETDKPVSQWRSRLTLSVMTDKISLDLSTLTSDIGQHIMLGNSNNEYLPVLFIDELSNRIRDLRPLNKSSKEMPLTIIYQPISIGKLRLWSNMKESLATLRNLGFTEKDSDEVKSIFVDTNLYLLLLTFVVAAFHLLFDFLAFKNDINYWRKRESMAGLSVRTVVWRCVSTIIIFLYLMDEQTSLLVLIPAGIGSVIEIWKVLKAFKVKLSWTGWRPHVTLGTATENELATQAFDQQAMKWLLYVLYPLCFAGAIYSLLYTPHKSWFSWCLQSLVNGVYAFGFIFMLPQLFINYKLKSVAHLPWKAFMYKAFNTFIDDIFAFIITMPTAHRLACFRDDFIFVIYLYQRWLYPVDKTRVNEFGQSFENEAGKSESVEKVAHGKNDVGKSESAEKALHGRGKSQESKKQK